MRARLVASLAALALALPAAVVAAAGSPGTLRLDYSHAGGRLLYACGFASIFGEWITTAEATTFVVRAPAPRRTLVAVEHVIDLYAGLRRTD